MRRAHDPTTEGLMRLIELQPKVLIETFQPNDMLLMRTETGDFFCFVVDKPKDSEGPLSGKLILPQGIMDLLGSPQVLDAAVITGSSMDGSSALYLEGIVQSFRVECRVPLLSLGPLLNEKERDMGQLLTIPPLEAAGVISIPQLPAPQREGLLELTAQTSTKQEPTIAETQVPDWPGKKLGIDWNMLDKALYLGRGVRGGGIRGRYYINPETGALSKMGLPIPAFPTVWDINKRYLESYRTNPRPQSFSLRRVAAFTWWALRLGLTPPEALLNELESLNLGLELPQSWPPPPSLKKKNLPH